ncbi:MAG: O-antigen ligase family protein, partial [Planctomycetota bacterium]
VLSSSTEWRISKLDIWIIAFFFLILGSLLIHTPRLESFRIGLPWMAFLLGYFLTKSLASQWKTPIYWIHLGAVAALWGSLDAIYQYYIGLDLSRDWLFNHPEGQEYLKQFSESEQTLFVSRLQTQRAYGNFLLPNFLAGYLGLWIPIFLGLLWDNRSSKKTLIAGVSALGVLLFALFLTKSRGGVLSLGIVLAFWFVYFSICARRFLQLLFWFTLAGAALFFYLVYFHYITLPPSLIFIENGVQSFGVRLTFWEVSWKMFLEYPFGVGINNFAEHYFRLKPPYAGETKFAHNNFFQLANELSLLGMIFFIGIFWVGLRSLKKDNDISTSKPIAPFIGGTFCIGAAYFFSNLFKGGTFDNNEQILFQLCSLAILLIFYHQIRFCSRMGSGVFCGIQLGLMVFLVHSMVDFDLYVFALFQQIFWLLALLKQPFLTKPFSSRHRIGLTVLALGMALFYLGFGILTEIQRELRKSQGENALAQLIKIQQELKTQPGIARKFSLNSIESITEEGFLGYQRALAIFPQDSSLFMDQAFLLETETTLFETLLPHQLPEKQKLFLEVILKQTQRTTQILDLVCLNTNSAEPFIHLAEMQKRYAQRQFPVGSELYCSALRQKVIPALLQAIQKYPVRPRSHLQLGLVWWEIQEIEATKKTLETALQMSYQAWNQEEHFTDQEKHQIQKIMEKILK